MLTPSRAAALLAAVALAGPARAADPAFADTALGKVPADAAAFATTLRLGESVKALGETRAWQRVAAEPMVQQLVQGARAGLTQGPGAAVLQFFAEPDNQPIPGLVGDAFANEVFAYSGPGWGDTISLFQEAVGAGRYGPAIDKALGNEEVDKETARVRNLLQALAEDPKRLRVPEFVIGFKVSDPAAVAAQLQRLDPLLADALKETPATGTSKREKVGGDEFLTLTLDGKLLPLDQLDLAKYETEKGEFDALVKHVRGLTVTVAVGVRQGYLLIAIGDSAAHVARFGAGRSLAEQAELKPLARFAGKPVIGLNYASAALRAAVATSGEDVTGLGELAKLLVREAQLPPMLRDAIDADVEELTKVLAREVPTPGAAVGASLRTPTGWETFAFDQSPPAAGPAKPLAILDHLGGTPVLAVVGRSATTPEDFRAFAGWVEKFAGHVEKAALARDSDEVTDAVKRYRQFVPLFRRFGEITEKQWIPALADGQEAFVLDAKWASKQWHQAAPPADRPLPFLEPAVVLGVSDHAKLAAALEAYRVLVNDLLAKAREVAPENTPVPELAVPKPTVETVKGLRFAHYPIPEEWGVDAQFQPTGGLSDSFAAVALSRGHAERLLKKTPLKPAAAAPLAGNKPLDSVTVFDWAGLVDAVGPWVEFGLGFAGTNEEVARPALELLGVFRGYTSATYREGGMTVTHSEAAFRDLPASK